MALPLMPHQLLLLPDGRSLSFNEYGDPRGLPVVWNHGAPSCRLEAALYAPWAAENGVRIIAPDRPGVGRSTPLRGGCVGDWAGDIAALLEHLGLERVTVMGGSGGGPYTLAVAALCPERVEAAVILASGGVDPASPRASGWVDRAAGLLAHRAPVLLGAYFQLMRLQQWWPAGWLRGVARWMPGPEAAVLREPGVAELVAPVFREVFAQGVAGAVAEYRRLGGAWGFRTAEITGDVVVVQGDADAFVPVRQAVHFAEEIPGARLSIVEGGGHIGVIRDWGRVARLLNWDG